MTTIKQKKDVESLNYFRGKKKKKERERPEPHKVYRTWILKSKIGKLKRVLRCRRKKENLEEGREGKW